MNTDLGIFFCLDYKQSAVNIFIYLALDNMCESISKDVYGKCFDMEEKSSILSWVNISNACSRSTSSGSKHAQVTVNSLKV